MIKTEGKDDECEIISSYNIDEIKGLDNFWNIILRTKDQKILSISINILFQIYKNKYAEKLLEKCNNLINGENSNPEIIEKCLMLLKLIIIESEKDVLFKPKSHLSLLKNCLIHLSLNSKNRKPDLEKSILFGNTTLNDLKIIISNLYEILPESAIFSLSEEYLNKVKEIKNIKNKQLWMMLLILFVKIISNIFFTNIFMTYFKWIFKFFIIKHFFNIFEFYIRISSKIWN